MAARGQVTGGEPERHAPATEQNQPLKAAVWMLGALLSFSSMAVAARLASARLDTFEIMLYRSLVGLVVVLAVAAAAGRLGEISRRRLGLHLLRNSTHFAGQNLWLFAIATIPLAQVFALEFTVPLWVALLAPLVLGERLTRLRAVTAGIGFIGVLIVARPVSIGVESGHLAALLAALGFAGSAMATKLLTRDVTTTCILFWLTAMQTVMGLFAAGIDGAIALPDAATLGPAVVVGLAGLGAHFCLTSALRCAPASVVMPLDFLRLPLISVVGMLLFAEPLEVAVFLGALVIFGANYANLLGERRRALTLRGR